MVLGGRPLDAPASQSRRLGPRNLASGSQSLAFPTRALAIDLPPQYLQIPGDGFDPPIEVRQVELLIGRVQIVVR